MKCMICMLDRKKILNAGRELRLGLWAALVSLSMSVALPAYGNDSIQVTPLSDSTAQLSMSGSSFVHSQAVSWGPAGGLLPEQEWNPYVHRPSAFTGTQAALDPARIPLLTKNGGKGRSSGARAQTRAASSRSQTAAKNSAAAKAPTPADPCAEKVRLALEKAAKAGKISASAVPAAPATAGQRSENSTGKVSGQSLSVPSSSAQSSRSASSGGAGSVTGQIQSGQGTYPYDATASNIAPGTAAQGLSAPSPELGAGAVPAPSTQFTAPSSQQRM